MVVLARFEHGGRDVGGGWVAFFVEALAPVTDASLWTLEMGGVGRERWGWDGAGADGFGARKGGVSGTILSESACVPSRAKKPVTRSHGVCVSSESPSHQSPTQCSAGSRVWKGKDGQRGYAHSRSRNQKVHRFGARLLFRRLPGPRRTFVVDDARRAVAAVVRALDERDHRVYAQEG